MPKICAINKAGEPSTCGIRPTRKMQTKKIAYRKLIFGVAGFEKQPVYLSKEFTTFLRKNPGVLTLVRDIMTKKQIVLDAGNKVYDKAHQIGIQLICCQRNVGSRNEGTYRVTIRGQVFFVKRNLGTMDPRRAIEETLVIRDIIKKHKQKIGHITLGMIRPHLVSAKLYVSDFFALGEVQLVAEVAGEKRIELDAALKTLQQEARWPHRIEEVSAENTFYNKKTNTLFLFDWTPTRTDSYDYQDYPLAKPGSK
jgi:hypothetical protein